MELHPEYIRDMHNHYMILKGNTEDKFNYTAKMLMNNSVPGILRTELRYLDSLDLYYYDITSKKTLKSVYESKSIDYETTKGIIKEVLQIIDNSQEYLLIEHDFIVNPEFVFIDHKQQVGLCYMPGFSSNILEQLSYFFEYIMNKIDYKDESAVRLIYALYKVSKDVECTFHKLYEVINHPYTIQESEKKRLHKDEPQVSTSQDLAINKTQLSNHYNEKLKIDKIQKKEYRDNYQNNSKSKRNKAGRNKKYTTIEDKNKTIINNKNIKNNGTGINKNDTIGTYIINTTGKNKNNETDINKSTNKMNTSINTIKKSINTIKSNLHTSFKVENIQDLKRQNDKGNNINEPCKKSGTNLNGISNQFVGKKNSELSSGSYHIKSEADESEVVNEREVLFFGQRSYLLAGSSIVIGSVILLIAYFSGIVSNTLGSGVDSVKMFACFLMVVCVEIYIMTKIFDPNKKLTKMETVLEYLKEETDNNINSSLDSNQEGDRILRDDLLNLQNIENSNEEFKEEKTQVLWKDNNSTNECEKTQLLTYLEKSKYYYLTPIKVKVGTNEKLTKVKVSEYPFYIGKSTNLSNLVIEDKSISRRHGIITCMEDKILYTDLDSTNGTYINGNKLEGNKAYTLSPFDEISFANLKYLWEELEE